MSNDAIYDLAQMVSLTRDEMKRNLLNLGIVVMREEKDRGDGRKAHYGSGRQPLDDIVDAGWGHQFCAGNVLKYLRRDKQVEDSRAKAIWYWKKMHELGGPDKYRVFDALVALLTTEELEFLNGK